MNDVGFQPEPGKLVVLGRADDILNIGGEKISPYPIESALNAIDGLCQPKLPTVSVAPNFGG